MILGDPKWSNFNVGADEGDSTVAIKWMDVDFSYERWRREGWDSFLEGKCRRKHFAIVIDEEKSKQNGLYEYFEVTTCYRIILEAALNPQACASLHGKAELDHQRRFIPMRYQKDQNNKSTRPNMALSSFFIF